MIAWILVAVFAATTLASLGLAWQLYRNPRIVDRVTVRGMVVPPRPMLPASRARDDEPPTPQPSEYLGEPQALPDAPESVPDSTVDGVRLGDLTVRAAAVRGITNRRDGRVRRQVASLSIVDSLRPAALLSIVAAGDPGGQISQIGAVQAARSIHGKLTEYGHDLDEAWRRQVAGDESATQHLVHGLRAVLAGLTEPLADVARRRDLPPAAAATQLTCVLTRLGDGDHRQHLAFGLGDGSVHVRNPDQPLSKTFGGPDSAASGTLPFDHQGVRVHAFETHPGDLVVLCTGTTAVLMDRAAQRLEEEWSTVPGMARFLYQLSIPDEVCRDDRAAVCLWEGGRRGGR